MPFNIRLANYLELSIRLAAKVVNYKVNKAGLVDIVGRWAQNIQGKTSRNLMFMLMSFIQTLINREIVCGIASEENDEFITVEGSDNSHNNMYVWTHSMGHQI
jgi:fructose-1,6-bisphosphatase I